MTAPANDAAIANLLKVVVMRILRLDQLGAIVHASDASYVSSQAIMLQYTPNVPARERFEQPNGNGDVCALYVGNPKAPTDCAMKLTACRWDAEMEELLCGGSILLDANYGTIGYRPPEDTTVNVNGVALETWSIAWNGKQRKRLGNSVAFWRHVFPMTTWQRDQATLQNGLDNPSYTGEGTINSGLGTGLASDPLPSAIGNVPYEWYLDKAAPAGADGYVTVP
jgi:hypothetical protein